MLLAACLDQPQSAGDLAELSKLALASVSEHLKVLRKTGLLELDRRGRFWFYQTDAEKLRAVAIAIARLSESANGT